MPSISEIFGLLDKKAPLALQEDYDNSGVQVCCEDGQCTGVLVCLDITEAVIDEAIEKGCNLVLSHHPLFFSPLKKITAGSFQSRCVIKAVRSGVSLYSAHTSLDNAPGGVNFKIASVLGLENLKWLDPKTGPDGEVTGGSGLVGELPETVSDEELLALLAEKFNVHCVAHSACSGNSVSKVALCGGAGSFLMKKADEAGADCFVTGEISYHHFFDSEDFRGCGRPMLLVSLGHYQSEQYTQDLLCDLLSETFPGLKVRKTVLNTNPISYFTK